MAGFNDLDLAEVWLKASGCNSNACVEVAATGRLSAIRDSKDPDGAILLVDRGVFNALLADCKAGKLDL